MLPVPWGHSMKDASNKVLMTGFKVESSDIPIVLRVVQITWLFNLNKWTMNPMDLQSRADETSDVYIHKSHDSVIPERNAASPQPTVFTVNWPDFPYACQKLSHWHLTKKHYLLAKWIRVLQLQSIRQHFPTTFWELRLGVISDVLAIAKSPRA